MLSVTRTGRFTGHKAAVTGSALGGASVPWELDSPIPTPPDPKECGERALMRAVLEDAVDNIRARNTNASESRAWIMTEDYRWPFSFNRICETLGYDPSWVRRNILKDAPPPPLVVVPTRPIRTPESVLVARRCAVLAVLRSTDEGLKIAQLGHRLKHSMALEGIRSNGFYHALYPILVDLEEEGLVRQHRKAGERTRWWAVAERA